MTDTKTASWLWIAVLAIATVGGSPVAACVLPFAAAAAIAGLTLDLPRAMIAVITVWALNQAIGFGLMDYPMTQYSFGWGAGILGASVATMLVARAVKARIGGDSAMRAVSAVALAFIAGFVTYEGLLFVLANFVGGLETFSPEIVSTIGFNDTIWFVLLMGLRWALVQAVPARFGRHALTP